MERNCDDCKYSETDNDSTDGFPFNIVFYMRDCKHPDQSKQFECFNLIEEVIDYYGDSEPIPPVEDCPHWVDYRPIPEIRKEKIENFIKDQDH